MPNGRISWTAYEGDDVVVEIREFVVYLEARHYAPSTIHHYARHVVRLGNYLAASGRSYVDLTPMELDAFIPAAAQLGRTLDFNKAMNIVPIRPNHADVSTGLYNQIVFAVKAFYEFMDMRHASIVFDRRRSANSPESFKPFLHHIKHLRSRRQYEARSDKNAKAAVAKRAANARLTPDQVLSIIRSTTKMRDGFMVVLLYVTGMRIGEARGLLHEDFKISENIIWVNPRILENNARVKNSKARPILVPEFIMRMYEDYISSDEYIDAFETGTDFVFCNIKKGRIGRGLTEANIYEIQAALVRRSGVDFSWHRFRHTHASETIAQGYSLLDVADRLGHASPQTTNAIYKHLFNAEYRKMHLQTHKNIENKLDDMQRQAISEGRVKWLGQHR